MTHEALGHGGYCLALGGYNVMLTTLGEACSVQPPGIEAAGPGMQFGAGLLAWFVVHRMSSGAAGLRYFFWLYMVFDLFVAAGYVVFSGVTDFGDAAVLISELRPHLVWRGGLSRLVWIPYASAGVFACCAGALNRTMGHGASIALAAASSFGGTWGILRIPDMQSEA
jgi:hypothetical protein